MMMDASSPVGGGMTYGVLVERIQELKEIWEPATDRRRIRALMDGGAEGIRALLGDKVRNVGDDIPAPNLMSSGLDRLAQKLGAPPILRCDLPGRVEDEARARELAEKRERIVENYDRICNLDMQLPQISRWLPGYGFAVWVVRHYTDRNGNSYPLAEMRDPYDCYPGYWGPHQQPTELACVRRIPRRTLAAMYPQHRDAIENPQRQRAFARIPGSGGVYLNPTESRWESGTSSGVEVVEYHNERGTWLYCPEAGRVLDYIPNPFQRPRFVVAKRFSFNALRSQYTHVIGLMAQMAKLNVLNMIAVEDAVFTETNVIGDVPHRKYNRGRFQTNFLPPGTVVDKPQTQVPFQTFQAIDRIERHLRIGAGYPITDDSEAPSGWVTGQGFDRLTEGSGLQVKEYQTILADALERLDEVRLLWDEAMYPNERKPLVFVANGAPQVETYKPSADIKGNTLTRRIYGVMAGMDEPQKIVGFLQLQQARLMDRRTIMENLQGLDDVNQILRRILEDDTEQALVQLLSQRAMNPQDPEAQRAILAIIEMNQNPDRKDDILAKFFTPQEPQMSLQEEEYLQGPPEVPGQPRSVATVLSRLESSGASEGGVQTVGRL